MKPVRDEFLSEEDLDLRNMSRKELVAYWNLWLEQAQGTNAADEHTYSHGVFVSAPRAPVIVAEERTAYPLRDRDKPER